MNDRQGDNAYRMSFRIVAHPSVNIDHMANLAMLSADWLRCTDPADPERCGTVL